MSIGVQISQEVIDIFQDLKNGDNYRFAIYKLSADYQFMIVDTVGPLNATYDEFIAKLPLNDCRFAVFNFEFKEGDILRKKILLFCWYPDTAKIKVKMITAAVKDSLKRKLVGINYEIGATSPCEAEYDDIVERVKYH
eukprot:TRINITY_DN6799_c0_g1_i1.p1 TRINITY_DN6799_c0_g1~~TRINITY_DN6799_c0_g1_i1.p1  ORF type:complete len:138 (-),score=58.04 TRINITY_DN6799_c0_g1_i1:19-432(-)